MAQFDVEIQGVPHVIEAPDYASAVRALQNPMGVADAKTGAPLAKPGPIGADVARVADWTGESGYRAGTGIVQLLDQGLSKVGVTDPKQYALRTQAEDERRKEWEAAHGPDSGTAVDMAAALAPVGGAAGVLPKAAGWLSALRNASIVGGAVGATQFVPPGGSRAQNTAIGAGTAAVGHAVISAVPAVRNVVVRAVGRAQANPRVAASVDAAKDFFAGSKAVPNPQPYTVGQASGSPAVANLEKIAFGPAQQELYAKQADEAQARFGELANQAATASKIVPTSANVAGAVNDTLQRTVFGMRTARKAAWEAGLTKAMSLAGPRGGPGVVALNNLANEYGAILAEDANAFNINGKILPKAIGDAAAKVQAVTAAGGRIKVPTVNYVLQGLSQDAPHGAGVFLSEADQKLNMYRTRLKAALDRDLDTAGVDASSNPAFAEIMRTRKLYAQQSQALRDVENGTLNRLFGDPQALSTPASALDRFYKLRPADQQAAVDFLNKNHPEALDAMRAHRLETAIKDATTAGASKNSAFDFDAFNKSLFNGDSANSPLWEGAANVHELRAGAAHLRNLLNTPGSGGGSFLAPADIAINTVSTNPGFVARQVARALTSTTGDRLLGTREGLDALRTLATTTNRKTAAFTQALSYVMGMQQGNDPSNVPTP